MRTLLLIDDDDDLREALAETLVLTDEFEVLEASTAQEGLETSQSSRYDMILLDVGLPDMDGRDLCKLLRERGVNVPIIMLTGENGEANEVLGLESGANDYITKPFNSKILFARIKAHFRQFDQTEDASFSVGEAIFEPGNRLFIQPDSTKIKLTHKESGILKFLCKSDDRHAQREVLLREVWGYNSGISTHTLETHIYRLRQKIEIDPSHPSFLSTQNGGYTLAPSL
jgi:DNA-binding response OmpR family regulator